jgi:acetyl esterase/lipase
MAYVPEYEASFDSIRHRLDVFAPRKVTSPAHVLIFIHGGNWQTGEKSIYKPLGSRLARKGVVSVIINYRLSPHTSYEGMAMDVARSVKWVQENISSYGGDPEKIFVSGHSAGGQLASLVTIRQYYYDSLCIKNPVKGAILIDPGGMDMYTYLSENEFPENHFYLQTFTNDPDNWKEASPKYHLHPKMPPLLIYVGGRTYPEIQRDTKEFLGELKKYVPNPLYKVQPKKRHIPMIAQFFITINPRYKEILRFMKSPRQDPFNPNQDVEVVGLKQTSKGEAEDAPKHH